MYHYSYTFPDQVFKKVNYYKDSVSRQNCIDDYFNRVYLPWVGGQKQLIEKEFLGVHEFKPHMRGECYTEKFTDEHPESILRDLKELKAQFDKQLTNYR